MYDALPKNERSFDFDAVGETTGYHYKGTFTVKCILDVGTRHQLELEKTRLTADYANPSQGLRSIAIALSTLRTKITDSPAWWKDSLAGSNIKDEEVLYALYERCSQMEDEWRNELKKRAEEAQKVNVLKES